MYKGYSVISNCIEYVRSKGKSYLNLNMWLGK